MQTITTIRQTPHTFTRTTTRLGALAAAAIAALGK